MLTQALAIAKFVWKMQMQEWVGRHASFPPRRSIKWVKEHFLNDKLYSDCCVDITAVDNQKVQTRLNISNVISQILKQLKQKSSREANSDMADTKYFRSIISRVNELSSKNVLSLH